MEEKSTVLQTGIKYGIITALVVIVYTFILYLIGESMNMWLGFLSLIFIIGLMVFAMREYKNEHNGFLEYKEGLGIGTIMVAISSLLSQIFNFIYINYIDSSILGQAEEKTRAMLERFGMDEDKIEEAVIKSQEGMTSPMSIFWGFLWAVIIGFIISLIIAAIMQKKKSELSTLDAG